MIIYIYTITQYINIVCDVETYIDLCNNLSTLAPVVFPRLPRSSSQWSGRKGGPLPPQLLNSDQFNTCNDKAYAKIQIYIYIV